VKFAGEKEEEKKKKRRGYKTVLFFFCFSVFLSFFLSSESLNLELE